MVFMERIILETSGQLFPPDTATNIAFPFVLAAPAQALRIEYSYEPKMLADDALAERLLEAGMEHCVEPQDRAQFPIRSFLPLVNLVTLSVDAPDGYRGCAHRHDPVQTHVLRAEDSSPGFDDGAILAGSWQVVINVHAVVTSPCTYHLKVTAEGGDAR